MQATTFRGCAYTPYGYAVKSGSSIGFNGELQDPASNLYLLGNGYRAFSPELMRFNLPDELSPFAKGNINAYAYCQGDPVNRTDPSGAAPILPFMQEMKEQFFTSFIRNYKANAETGKVLATPYAQRIVNSPDKSFFGERVAGAFIAKDSNGALPLPEILQQQYDTTVKSANAGEISSTTGHLKMARNWFTLWESGTAQKQGISNATALTALVSHSLGAMTAGLADIGELKTGMALRRNTNIRKA